MRCCANCFGDREIAEIIRARSLGKGVCSYCGSANVDLIEPKQLSNYFILLSAIYEPDDNGKLLVELFSEDWNLFDHPAMNIATAKSLLADILDDGEVVRKPFLPSPRYKSDALGRWEQLRNELMYKNRYFPESQMNMDRLGELLEELIALDLPAVWYRARLQMEDKAFVEAEMGAPPQRMALHGRANPSGIPYLYLGSSVATAISEIRPHTGEVACVATVEIPPDLKVIDLRSPRKHVSPFLLEEDEIGLMRAEIGFLERLGEELTRPVLPQGAAIDYVPSQYLCEFIKKCGYGGVIYRSSVSDGINLALFEPSVAIIRLVEQHQVVRVKVQVEKIT